MGIVGVAVDRTRSSGRLGGARSEAGLHLHHGAQRAREHHARGRVFTGVRAKLHHTPVRIFTDNAIKKIELRIGMPGADIFYVLRKAAPSADRMLQSEKAVRDHDARIVDRDGQIAARRRACRMIRTPFKTPHGIRRGGAGHLPNQDRRLTGAIHGTRNRREAPVLMPLGKTCVRCGPRPFARHALTDRHVLTRLRAIAHADRQIPGQHLQGDAHHETSYRHTRPHVLRLTYCTVINVPLARSIRYPSALMPSATPFCRTPST